MYILKRAKCSFQMLWEKQMTEMGYVALTFNMSSLPIEIHYNTIN